MTKAALLNAMLALPPDERSKLALRALESVSEDAAELAVSEADWDAAWASEIGARLDRDEPSVPLADVITEMRARRG